MVVQQQRLAVFRQSLSPSWIWLLLAIVGFFVSRLGGWIMEGVEIFVLSRILVCMAGILHRLGDLCLQLAIFLGRHEEEGRAAAQKAPALPQRSVSTQSQIT